ncbi:Fmu (Sun) domain-containing protein [Agriterribacter sp.]|uniref:Fmu (Sun) domain-containing protein n=1 Tax=Agriterribacter sp. TaxID=2821509 RepID=UPI002C5145FB|nr:Fmu (Sun) domain-containing protein [Agriterribacter sp.]HRP55779.1 Fmu (Sun) domain-containing protein [Agriterribacter sp.]
MSRYHSYLSTAAGIIRRYKGNPPLAAFLKSFFAADKKYGSKDRRQISHLCYCYYRTGKMFYDSTLPDDEAIRVHILAGLFLCSSQPNETLQQLKPAWNERLHLSAEEKCEIVNKSLNTASTSPFAIHLSPLTSHLLPLHVFPWKSMLSEGIDHETFCRSFFIQPDLFIRIRPGYKAIVQQKLDAGKIPYRFIGKDCIAFSNITKLDAAIEADREAVVQDYSSQQVAAFFKPLQTDQQLSVWDCCAASGGKSILAKDILKNIRLTVSDIRKSILINLEKRFASAGIKEYTSKVIDLTDPSSLTSHHSPRPNARLTRFGQDVHPRLNASPKESFWRGSAGQAGGHSPLTIHHSLFDLIICDAPCSGSGTWSRTPEQLYHWKEEKLDHYTALQKKILANVIPFIKPGGHLLYITCSVFKRENEAMVDEIKERFNLRLLKMKVLKGYDKKADTLFAALLLR